MRFSKNFKDENFFKQKKILSPRAALFFVIEESFLLFLIAIQLSIFLGIRIVNGNILLFQNTIQIQNYIWLFGSIFFFIIGYFVIALRDKNVWLIHHNFSRLVFGTIKLKLEFTTLRIFVFVFIEFVFALLIALSIYIYLDPDVNLVPYPYNYISFILLIALAIGLFSHSKDFRFDVYGPTPIQKKLNLGPNKIKRVTNTKTGSIHFKEKEKKKKK
ncbi:MAG: hypothetical protein ACOX1V_02315 [Candidatus Iainarchaeum sp.]|jgi:hypothetical protein